MRIGRHRANGLDASYRECLKAEIAHTVASAAEVDEELRHLLRVMARR